MNTLPKFDTATLHKAFIGVDRMLDTFEHRFANQIQTNYPPHNIIKHDDYNYSIEIAVAGFAKSEISIEVQQDQLTVKGVKQTPSDKGEFIYRGLSSRDFIRNFKLAEHLEVRSAIIDNGILTILLELVIPETMKPRTIEINEPYLLTDK